LKSGGRFAVLPLLFPDRQPCSALCRRPSRDALPLSRSWRFISARTVIHLFWPYRTKIIGLLPYIQDVGNRHGKAKNSTLVEMMW